MTSFGDKMLAIRNRPLHSLFAKELCHVLRHPAWQVFFDVTTRKRSARNEDVDGAILGAWISAKFHASVIAIRHWSRARFATINSSMKNFAVTALQAGMAAKQAIGTTKTAAALRGESVEIVWRSYFDRCVRVTCAYKFELRAHIAVFRKHRKYVGPHLDFGRCCLGGGRNIK